MHELTHRLGINADYPDQIIRSWLEEKVNNYATGEGVIDPSFLRKTFGLTEEEKGKEIAPFESGSGIWPEAIESKINELITELNALKKGKK